MRWNHLVPIRTGLLLLALIVSGYGDGRAGISGLVSSVAAAEPSDEPSRDWRQFRGTDGQGHASGRDLPLRWNEKKNIVWKIPIRGHAWSSPVIAEDRVWLTTANAADKTLRVLCFDADTGQTILDVEAFKVPVFGVIHSKNSHATPTPILLDDLCYVHFGSHGTAALDRQGKILWKTKLEYYHHHGPASCPVIADGALIVACDGMTFSFYDDRKIADLPDPQFVAALELTTGKTRWKARRDGMHSYATPLVVDVDGRQQVISPGGNQVIAYDPHTGDEIWTCRYVGYSVVPRPVFGHGLVFVCTGYDSPSLLAIRPDGQGDVTETHIVWKVSKGVPLMSSPILVGDELYMVSHLGVVTCLDAKSGKKHWQQRIGGNHSSSPVYAEEKLYFLDESGTTHILQPGLKYKLLAKNSLPGKIQASLAVSGRAIFLRNDTHLYRIEESDSKSAAGIAEQTTDEDSEDAEKSNETSNAKPAE
jgi:outer membrane protein assembly factor BamB